MSDDDWSTPADRAQTRDYVQQMIVELARLLADAGDPHFAQQLIDVVRSQRDRPRKRA